MGNGGEFVRFIVSLGKMSFTYHKEYCNLDCVLCTHWNNTSKQPKQEFVPTCEMAHCVPRSRANQEGTGNADRTEHNTTSPMYWCCFMVKRLLSNNIPHQHSPGCPVVVEGAEVTRKTGIPKTIDSCSSHCGVVGKI